MNWAEQRAQILATIKSKKGVMQAIMTKAATEKRSTSDDEENQVKAVEGDLVRLEANLKRVDGFIADMATAATAATAWASSNSLPRKSSCSAGSIWRANSQGHIKAMF